MYERAVSWLESMTLQNMANNLVLTVFVLMKLTAHMIIASLSFIAADGVPEAGASQ